MMMHFLEDHQMNLPYFLLNSLRKMATKVQKKIQCIKNTMYHHGLVKILLEFHLQSIGDNWESFLVRNHFEEKSPEKQSSRRTLKGRKRTIEMKKEQAPQTQTKVTEEELLVVKILQRMKRGNLRRKKSNPSKEEFSQTKTPPLEEKSKNKRKKIQKIQTPRLRRSTRLSTIPQTTSKIQNTLILRKMSPLKMSQQRILQQRMNQ